MKTLSFDNLIIGRNAQTPLISLDSEKDGLVFEPGIHLIVAPNGRGKSTLFQTLSGILSPLEGRVRLGDRPLDSEKEVLYISEYLSFPKFIYPNEWIDFTCPSEEKFNASKFVETIHGFRLEEKMKHYLGRMSQGERRKITWLAALHSSQPIVLLDEPFDGLDLFAYRSAVEALRKLKSQGKWVILVSHQFSSFLREVDFAYGIFDRKLERVGRPREEIGDAIEAERFIDRLMKRFQS